MPNPKIHEDIDWKIFGESYPEVHKWIDGTYNGTNGRTHWIDTHYTIAIYDKYNPKDYPDTKQRERFVEVAKMHVMFDWALYYKRVLLPISRDDVIRELRSEGILVE
jgi:hypothetical protein